MISPSKPGLITIKTGVTPLSITGPISTVIFEITMLETMNEYKEMDNSVNSSILLRQFFFKFRKFSHKIFIGNYCKNDSLGKKKYILHCMQYWYENKIVFK